MSFSMFIIDNLEASMLPVGVWAQFLLPVLAQYKCK